MTTIAYRNGVMACDSNNCTSEGIKIISKTKLIRLPSGAVVGLCGDTDDRAFVETISGARRPKDLPSKQTLASLPDDIMALIAFNEHQVYFVVVSPGKPDDCCVVPTLLYKFAAIGSGAEFARGAMAQGATAEEAVRAACQFDLRSRPPVRKMLTRGRARRISIAGE